MRRAPYVAAAAVVLATAAMSIHVIVEPEPFSEGPSVALSAGSLLLAVICSAGLLLSRGRWARVLGLSLSGGVGALFIVIDTGVTSMIALALAVGAVALLSGPWLDGWLRKRPAALGPGPAAVALALLAIGLVPGTAIASPDAFDWQQGLLVAAALVVSFGYSRARVAALWALRVGLLPFSALAVAASPLAGGLYLAAHVAVVTGLAWSDESMLAVRPILDRHLGPRAPRPSRQTEADTE